MPKHAGYFAVICLLFVFALASISVSAQKRIYIAPDDHTDYMWTADEATYNAAFLNMLDYYLDRMDATAANPSQFQARFNPDGSFWLWTFEHSRTTAQFQRLMNRIQDGHLSAPLNALVLINGGTPAEAVIRGMMYPGMLERRYKVRFPMAVAMEDQTFPFGLPSLWAGSGAKYSWKGVCGCATHVTGLGDRGREIYYAGGLDGSKVLMKWNSLFDNQSIGGYAEARDPLASIDLVDSNSSFTSRYPYQVIGAFGQGWDDLQTTDNSFITAAQSRTTADRQVIVSNMLDFFQDFEASNGSRLQSYAASYGNEWELLVSSLAEVSAKIKRDTEKLRTVDAMSTMVALNDPGFLNSRTAQRDKAMLNFGLYFEHDWTADGPVSRGARAAWSRRLEQETSDYINGLDADLRVELGKEISRTGSEQRFYVFNPLSWTRSDFADIKMKLYNRKIKVVDVSTGQEVPSQILRTATGETLRIFAENIPSVGYKVFEIRPGAGQTISNAATVAGNVIENSFYRITIASDGAITSLIDKTRGDREVVSTVNGRVMNDLGGDRSGSVTVQDVGPASVTLRAVSQSPVGHQTLITLYHNSDRIDIMNEITQNFGSVRTWSYSFNISSPDVWHEEVGAVIRARLLNDGGHYAPANARYDWLTLNHFADIHNGSVNDFGITLSNWDDYFMKLGSSTDSSLDTSTPQINVLAGGQVDGSSLGIQGQGGDNYFLQRFAIRTHGAYDQTAAMKFALEHQNPFTTGYVDGLGNVERPYPSSSFSLVQISDPNVLLWAVKPAEDGISRGIVVRVWNQSGQPAAYSLGLSRPVTSAEKVTHIETTIGNATVKAGQLTALAAQQQIQTHLLRVN